jgi:hypothetical protein
MRTRLTWALALAALALAGCGGGGSNFGSPSSSSTSSSGVSSGASSTSSSTSSSGSSSSSTSSSGSSTSSSGVSSGSSSGGSSGTSGGSSGATSSGSSSSSSSSSSGSTTANVVSMVVDSGPAAAGGNVSNIAYVSIKLCQPGSTSACATIDHIQVDTGSAGLRVFASVLAGLTLPTMTDPSAPVNSVAECLAFLDGYVWGPVASADLTVGGESASAVPLHILNDNGSYTPTVPTACTAETTNTNLDNIPAFGANGIIGVNFLTQDCGPSCAECASFMGGCTSMNDMYYSCNAGSDTCNPTQVALDKQVVNPVALFTTDNNGVILQLPTVPQAGAVSATGSLIFGINTQSNNTLGTAFVLTVDDMGFFTSTFGGTPLGSSFIDSGSSAYFFNSSLMTCPSPNQIAYCPATPQDLSAVNQGHAPDGTISGSGNTSTVQFQIVSLLTLNGANFAFDDIGLTAATSTGTQPLNDDFDFGLPFFYGKSVYTGIEGRSAGTGGPTGPYFAY